MNLEIFYPQHYVTWRKDWKVYHVPFRMSRFTKGYLLHPLTLFSPGWTGIREPHDVRGLGCAQRFWFLVTGWGRKEKKKKNRQQHKKQSLRLWLFLFLCLISASPIFNFLILEKYRIVLSHLHHPCSSVALVLPLLCWLFLPSLSPSLIPASIDSLSLFFAHQLPFRAHFSLPFSSSPSFLFDQTPIHVSPVSTFAVVCHQVILVALHIYHITCALYYFPFLFPLFAFVQWTPVHLRTMQRLIYRCTMYHISSSMLHAAIRTQANKRVFRQPNSSNAWHSHPYRCFLRIKTTMYDYKALYGQFIRSLWFLFLVQAESLRKRGFEKGTTSENR